MKYIHIIIPDLHPGRLTYASDVIPLTCHKCCFRDIRNTTGCTVVLERNDLPICGLLGYFKKTRLNINTKVL